ncbi:hypothetical protein GCM10010869_13220 [Mesorhizobium tianshanense]|uniref:Lysozyme inhibitor LprI N-terminal domain-containing protein n=1 Tax=Mesorhizobium tianshanense TaxID=39844 RepID=A0A562P9D8_9HYPH|nr:hypothetical protein [Mesorhizobium tianshanense]TWI41074.1 hypothetical protein IQ26_01010 [Mesorhizobium tianshanense]GLS35733.1 hypothetical protein GCM10010869_13220 [Mesorhizobium tianshanense]
MGRFNFIGAILLALGFSSASGAAEIDVLDIQAGVDFVIIKGEITEGDGDRFIEVIQNREKVTVYLESPGGLIPEALRIGAEIRLRNYATLVAGGDGCFSACGLIWVSGARRYMSPDSLIGFHAAYIKKAGGYRESGVANAEIGSFLTHLGLRIEAIRFFTIAGPSDIRLLTPSKAKELGIDIFLLQGDDVVTPNDSPTGDRYAERWVLYNILRSRCQGYFQADASALEQGATEAFAKGNEILGSEKWVDLWLQLLDQWAAQIEPRGPVVLCVEVEENLRSQGLPTGIHGPSFDCAKAATPAERTMCADQNLWAKDRAMNAIYFWIRNNVEADLRKRILAVQRGWLAIRNNCDADSQCLNSVYDQRLQELKLVVIR